jgi:predicted transcriptional regulator
MPRRKSYDQQLSVPVEQEIKQKLEKMASDRKSTVSQLVRLALEEFVNRETQKGE